MEQRQLRDGGPPPDPFTDPQAAEKWLSALFTPQPDPRIAEAEALRLRLRQAFEGNGQIGYEKELELCREERQPPEPPRAFSPAEINEPRPRPIIWGKGLGGSVLSLGAACLLSGEGGIAKTAFGLQIAVNLAAADDGATVDVGGGLLGVGQSVLFGSYEDCLGELNWRVNQLVDEMDAELRSAGRPEQYSDALSSGRLRLMNLSGWPIYGAGSGTSYNCRPMPLPGWQAIWDQVREHNSGLVIIDPALAAYAANHNDTAAVREFLSALAWEARRHDRSLMMLAHSNKNARGAQRGGPGSVSGSTAWPDGVRGVLTLDWAEKGRPGELDLRIEKCNRGPQKVSIPVDRLRRGGLVKGGMGKGAVIGLKEAGPWMTDAERQENVTRQHDKEAQDDTFS